VSPDEALSSSPNYLPPPKKRENESMLELEKISNYSSFLIYIRKLKGPKRYSDIHEATKSVAKPSFLTLSWLKVFLLLEKFFHLAITKIKTATSEPLP
jgi:hypothetical protein